MPLRKKPRRKQRVTGQDLAESIQKPEFLMTDFAKMEAPGTLAQLSVTAHRLPDTPNENSKQWRPRP